MSITIQGLVSRVSRFAAILGLLAAAGTAAAQTSSDNAIERIDATQTTTGVVVTIELNSAFRTPLDAEMRQMWLDLLRWMSERVTQGLGEPAR